jgi:hypothetical protein
LADLCLISRNQQSTDLKIYTSGTGVCTTLYNSIPLSARSEHRATKPGKKGRGSQTQRSSDAYVGACDDPDEGLSFPHGSWSILPTVENTPLLSDSEITSKQIKVQVAVDFGGEVSEMMMMMMISTSVVPRR